jgi:serine/threonine protein phosphatase PrpC
VSGLRAGAATDVGLVRSNNQDRLLVASSLFAVADGMGGHAAGEVASQVAVEALERAFEALEVPTSEGLGQAARQANRMVWERAQTDPALRGMGTTLVALALVRSSGPEEIAIVNVGDSRAYRLRGTSLQQLTVDHSLVQELVDEGQLQEEEMAFHPQRHVLTRALGVDPDVAVDVIGVAPEPGDRFLLCSDGLIREVGDEMVASVLRRLDDPDDAARELVEVAKEHGGADNITVVVVDVTSDDTVAGAAPVPVSADLPPPPAHLAPEVASDGGGVPEDASPPPPRRLARRRHRVRRPASPMAHLLTARVVLFAAVLVGLLAVAAAGVVWYARDNYFVGLSGDRLTIFQGRPGGVLWFQPTVARRTSVTTSDVLAYHLSGLRAGQDEPSVSAAWGYIHRLQSEHSQARAQ